MARKREPIDPALKVDLRFPPETPDAEIYEWWKRVTSRYCKPCWELRYCPYGPLVEQSPYIGVTREEATAHQKDLRMILRTGVGLNGRPIGAFQRAELRKMVKGFRAEEYPESIPETFLEMNCNVFGHVCPVIYAAEEFTETSGERRTGRYIPFKMPRQQNLWAMGRSGRWPRAW